jgi:hypothetical protein
MFWQHFDQYVLVFLPPETYSGFKPDHVDKSAMQSLIGDAVVGGNIHKM